uniref:Uncharacterized protein n=1 Tax=Anopheles maculatus TaxID=74869 RepID=A0A182TBE6_9DIPT
MIRMIPCEHLPGASALDSNGSGNTKGRGKSQHEPIAKLPQSEVHLQFELRHDAHTQTQKNHKAYRSTAKTNFQVMNLSFSPSIYSPPPTFTGTSLCHAVEPVLKFPVLIQLESVLWLTASVMLVAGLYKESKNYITPFLALFVADGVVVIVQETVNLCTGRMSELATIDTRQLVVMILANVYVLVSLIVLYRMFGKEPLPSTQNNFVRFDNEQDVETGTGTGPTTVVPTAPPPAAILTNVNGSLNPSGFAGNGVTAQHAT